jgi:TonB-dependent SusC/RagA subfamily outer membrane receptor
MLFGVPSLNAQNATGHIVGVVQDSAGNRPIAGARVQVGSDLASSVLTDSSGHYRLRAPLGPQTISARRIGYAVETRHVVVDTSAEVRADFILPKRSILLEGTIVAGVLTDTSKGGTISLDTAGRRIFATAAGASIVTAARISGGYEFASILTNTAPMLYVDGVLVNWRNPLDTTSAVQRIYSLNNLNPESIETIEVLKGSSAVAIYGSAAIDGVILVRTRSRVLTDAPGESEFPKADVPLGSFRLEWQQLMRVVEDSLAGRGWRRSTQFTAIVTTWMPLSILPAPRQQGQISYLIRFLPDSTNRACSRPTLNWLVQARGSRARTWRAVDYHVVPPDTNVIRAWFRPLGKCDATDRQRP